MNSDSKGIELSLQKSLLIERCCYHSDLLGLDATLYEVVDDGIDNCHLKEVAILH